MLWAYEKNVPLNEEGGNSVNSILLPRLEYEARNKKKEEKEMRILEELKAQAKTG